MIWCLFCMVLFLGVFIFIFCIKKDRRLYKEKWTVINVVIVLLAIILFVNGLLANMKYTKKCIYNGEKTDVVITDWRFPSGRGLKSWFEYEAETTNEDKKVSFCSSKYYKRGELVSCFVWKNGKKSMTIDEKSKQCQKGNEILSDSAVLWVLAFIVYGLRHDLLDFGKWKI